MEDTNHTNSKTPPPFMSSHMNMGMSGLAGMNLNLNLPLNINNPPPPFNPMDDEEYNNINLMGFNNPQLAGSKASWASHAVVVFDLPVYVTEAQLTEYFNSFYPQNSKVLSIFLKKQTASPTKLEDGTIIPPEYTEPKNRAYVNFPSFEAAKECVELSEKFPFRMKHPPEDPDDPNDEGFDTDEYLCCAVKENGPVLSTSTSTNSSSSTSNSPQQGTSKPEEPNLSGQQQQQAASGSGSPNQQEGKKSPRYICGNKVFNDEQQKRQQGSKFYHLGEYHILYLKERKFPEVMSLKSTCHVQIYGVKHFSSSILVNGTYKNIEKCKKAIDSMLEGKNVFEIVEVKNPIVHDLFSKQVKMYMRDIDAVVIIKNKMKQNANSLTQNMKPPFYYNFFGSQEGVNQAKEKIGMLQKMVESYPTSKGMMNSQNEFNMGGFEGIYPQMNQNQSPYITNHFQNMNPAPPGPPQPPNYMHVPPSQQYYSPVPPPGYGVPSHMLGPHGYVPHPAYMQTGGYPSPIMGPVNHPVGPPESYFFSPAPQQQGGPGLYNDDEDDEDEMMMMEQQQQQQQQKMRGLHNHAQPNKHHLHRVEDEGDSQDAEDEDRISDAEENVSSFSAGGGFHSAKSMKTKKQLHSPKKKTATVSFSAPKQTKTLEDLKILEVGEELLISNTKKSNLTSNNNTKPASDASELQKSPEKTKSSPIKANKSPLKNKPPLDALSIERIESSSPESQSIYAKRLTPSTQPLLIDSAKGSNSENYCSICHKYFKEKETFLSHLDSVQHQRREIEASILSSSLSKEICSPSTPTTSGGNVFHKGKDDLFQTMFTNRKKSTDFGGSSGGEEEITKKKSDSSEISSLFSSPNMSASNGKSRMINLAHNNNDSNNSSRSGSPIRSGGFSLVGSAFQKENSGSNSPTSSSPKLPRLNFFWSPFQGQSNSPKSSNKAFSSTVNQNLIQEDEEDDEFDEDDEDAELEEEGEFLGEDGEDEEINSSSPSKMNSWFQKQQSQQQGIPIGNAKPNYAQKKVPKPKSARQISTSPVTLGIIPMQSRQKRTASTGNLVEELRNEGIDYNVSTEDGQQSLLTQEIQQNNNGNNPQLLDPSKANEMIKTAQFTMTRFQHEVYDKKLRNVFQQVVEELGLTLRIKAKRGEKGSYRVYIHGFNRVNVYEAKSKLIDLLVQNCKKV